MISLSVHRETFRLPRAVEGDVEVFAIGDIHGRADLLEALIAEAAREPRLRPKRALVLLGDLIDRGPENLRTLALAEAAGARVGADEQIALMGNHETMMRLALDPSTPRHDALDALETWIANGGDRVLAEFVPLEASPATLGELLDVAKAALPSGVAAWLAGLRAHWRSGEILFVHAGVHPDVDLEDFLSLPWNMPLRHLDEERHWAWVRRPFLEAAPDSEGWSGFCVVHGHTPNDGWRLSDHADQIRRFRLNLDAGSGITGEAKMAILRGNEAVVATARGQTNAMLRR